MLEMLEVLAKCNIGIDPIIPGTVRMVVNILKIAIPILLIIFGMLDLSKAVMSNDEKEMKGAQTKFIKRCLYAVAVFFIVAIVQFIFKQLGNASQGSADSVDSTNIGACISCFVSDSSACK